MPSKKTAKKTAKQKSKRPRTTLIRDGKPQRTRFRGGVLDLIEADDDLRNPYGPPVHLNPETKEEREKRLAARKALTLRAFQTTYENRHRRKAS